MQSNPLKSSNGQIKGVDNQVESNGLFRNLGGHYLSWASLCWNVKPLHSGICPSYCDSQCERQSCRNVEISSVGAI